MIETNSEDSKEGILPYRPPSKSNIDIRPDRPRTKKSAKSLRALPKERRNTASKPHKHRSKSSGSELIPMMKTEQPSTPPNIWVQKLADRSHEIPPSPASPLGAGRLDPFGVYPTDVYQPNSGALPMYVHEVIDHCINHTALAFVPSNNPDELALIRRHIMMNVMTDTLSWYTIVLAGVTHLSFVKRETEIPREKQMLRLSYKTEAMSGIREEITRNNGKASDRALLAMNTLASHGALDDISSFTYDKIQNRKGFGAANDMNYYSLMRPGTAHYESMVKFVEDRGGIKSTLASPGLATGLAL